MLSRTQWQAIRDSYFQHRSISKTAQELGMNRKTVCRYVTEDVGDYPSIRSLVRASENLDAEKYVICQRRVSQALFSGVGKIRLKLRGKKDAGGTLEISTNELIRLQKILHEYATWNLEQVDRMRNSEQDTPRFAAQPYMTAQDRARQEDIQHWLSIERKFLTPEQMRLPQRERDRLLEKHALLALCQNIRQHRIAVAASATENVFPQNGQ